MPMSSGAAAPPPARPPSSVAGLDLHLDRPRGRVRDSVMDAIRDAIRSGRLVSGTRLPSSRALSADLGVARNTVARAYAELIAEGWLTSQHGSGTLVSQRAEQVVRSVASPPGRRAPRRLDHDLRARSSRPVVVSAVGVESCGQTRTGLGTVRGVRLCRHPGQAGTAPRPRPVSRSRSGRSSPTVQHRRVQRGRRGSEPHRRRSGRRRGHRRGGRGVRTVLAVGVAAPSGITVVPPLPVDGDGADIEALRAMPEVGRSAAHTVAPVSARRVTAFRPARSGHRLGAANRWRDHRGRLRRGVPLRPQPGRCAARRSIPTM